MKIGGTVWGLARPAVRLKGCCGRTEAAVVVAAFVLAALVDGWNGG